MAFKTTQHKDEKKKHCHRCGGITSHTYVSLAEAGVSGPVFSGTNEFFRTLNPFGDYSGTWLWRCDDCGHYRTGNKTCVTKNCQ